MERRIKIGMRIANEKMSNYTVIKESVTFGGKEMNPALLFSLFWSQAGNLLIKLCSCQRSIMHKMFLLWKTLLPVNNYH